MRLNLFETQGKTFYEANIWYYYGIGDPLALEYFTTKREAIAFIKRFVNTYKGSERLFCYVTRFDCDGFADESFDVEV